MSKLLPFATNGINCILEDKVVIKSIKDLTKRTYPPTGLPTHRKPYKFLLPRAQWDHGGIFHQDKRVDYVMSVAPLYLELYPLEITRYKNRRHAFWNKCIHRYIAHYHEVNYKKEITRQSRESARNGWLWGKTMRSLQRKAQFSHGGFHHQNSTINDLICGWSHIAGETTITAIEYERPMQRFWLFLYFKFDKLIKWWYR